MISDSLRERTLKNRGPCKGSLVTYPSVRPGAPNTGTQTGWGGVVFSQPSEPVTSITATFTIPTLSGETGAVCSIWVGIGNVMQTGIFCYYVSGASGNNEFLDSPWTWFLSNQTAPGTNCIWDTSTFTLAAGNELTLTFSYDETYWYSTQTNHTAGWSYTQQATIQSVNLGNDTWNFPYPNAEIIIEKESAALPNYGTLVFSDVATTPAINTSYITYVDTVNTDTDQTGVYSNGTFTMTWENYA